MRKETINHCLEIWHSLESTEEEKRGEFNSFLMTEENKYTKSQAKTLEKELIKRGIPKEWFEEFESYSEFR